MGSGDVGKELPRNKSVVFVLLLGERSHIHDRELSQHACLFRGYTLGSTIVVRGALHTYTFNSNLKKNLNASRPSEDPT